MKQHYHYEDQIYFIMVLSDAVMLLLDVTYAQGGCRRDHNFLVFIIVW